MFDDLTDYYNINLDNIDALRAHIFGLTIECPIGGKQAGCQIYNIQTMLIEEKIDWVNDLSHELCIKIYQKHRKCLAIKESI